jgi:hypothetical protein
MSPGRLGGLGGLRGFKEALFCLILLQQLCISYI